MNFCLNDGSPLALPSQRDVATENYPGLAVHKSDEQPQQTVEYSPSPSQYISARTIANRAPVGRSSDVPAKSNSYVWIFVALGLFGMVALGAGLAGAVYFLRSRNTDVAVANKNTARAGNANSENTISNLSTGNIDTSRNNDSTVQSNSSSLPFPNSNTSANRKGAPTPKPTPSTGEVTPPAAPTPERSTPKTVAGGVLNGKAISLPKPAYPPAARAVNASGMVQVQVLIDETGRVVSASAVSGHPLLQPAAVAAARGARFSPTLLSGQPVKVSGIITYNFVL